MLITLTMSCYRQRSYPPLIASLLQADSCLLGIDFAVTLLDMPYLGYNMESKDVISFFRLYCIGNHVRELIV